MTKAFASTPVSCHLCSGNDLQAFVVPGGLPAVTSDCRPWPGQPEVVLCRSCGLAQKRIDAPWRSEAARVYGSYALYHQTADGTEQVIFDQATGKGVPRSELMFRALLERFALPGRGRMLDLGCGTGPTLRAFSGLMQGWELNGFDPHLPDPERVRQIAGVERVYEGTLEQIDGAFELLSAVHVLEHVTEPLAFLRGARRLLQQDGLFLVQVPYFPDTPFDFAVFDHCSHFTVRGIERLFQAAGLKVELVSTSLLPKEITVVARLAAAEAAVLAPGDAWLREDTLAVQACLDWLNELRVQALAQPGERVGVFGTSIGGNWLLGLLGERIAFFVDEDPGRAGSTYRERPVYAPSQVPAGCRVLMPLPHALAQRIKLRLRPQQFELVLPPPYMASARN
jgi:SAM-dependent methyltransferase